MLLLGGVGTGRPGRLTDLRALRVRFKRSNCECAQWDYVGNLSRKGCISTGLFSPYAPGKYRFGLRVRTQLKSSFALELDSVASFTGPIAWLVGLWRAWPFQRIFWISAAAL